jgi:CDGSH-type Zn-finger protein
VVRLRQEQKSAVLRRLAQGHGFAPVEFTAEKSEKVWFCGCKRTAKPPLCDGSHKKS